MMMKYIHIACALGVIDATSAMAQNDTSKYPAAPATILFRTTCTIEAQHYGLKEPDRSAFMADCHAQRLAARAQINQSCRQAARERRFWGLARHKFMKKCVAQTKSFVVQPRIKSPPAPVFTPNP